MSNHSSDGVRLEQVDRDHAGQRLDNFLAGRLKGVPRSAVYRMIRTGQVRINGGRARAATRLSEGDTVRIPPARVREGPSAAAWWWRDPDPRWPTCRPASGKAASASITCA